MKLRPEVRRFAERMERALRGHDNDRGDSWRTMYSEDVMDGIERELKELKDAPSEDEAIQKECADVANFLMFYSEKRRHLKKYKT